MRLFKTILLLLVLSVAIPSSQGIAQGGHGNVTWALRAISSPETDSLFRILDHSITSDYIRSMPIGKRMIQIGRMLLGRPYIDKSLEVGNDSGAVVCNLQGFDCVTLFENCWALARLSRVSHNPNHNWDLAGELAKTRYRDFAIDGFQSRLHYTTDYFYRNTERAFLKEMTRSIGKKYAVLETKPINFMTTHPDLYPQLKDNPAMIAKMDSIERMIAARGGFYYIKKENIEKIESEIQDGDLIGVTTSIPGIDISHTGIAVRQTDGRIHFLNASSVFHKVIISKEPLSEYLANNSKQTGIIIYRPQEVQ